MIELRFNMRRRDNNVRLLFQSLLFISEATGAHNFQITLLWATEMIIRNRICKKIIRSTKRGGYFEMA